MPKTKRNRRFENEFPLFLAFENKIQEIDESNMRSIISFTQ